MPEDKGLTRSEREEKILQFWKENKIFEKTLEKKAPKGEFVFYEGPPTANGKPGIHHLEARSFKDAIPRYKTMRGYRVPRKAGWDTHGLPVELEVEKQLGLRSKKEIEDFGVAKFNEECRKNVWKYVDDWQRFTNRMGYWVDLEHPYVTYHNSYIESVWKIISEVEKRKLLYKDYKVVPWCPRCGTGLSSHELAQGYQDVKDLSLYVKFKLIDFPNAYFLAWTTTPWTLPGNLALAVGPDIVYVEAKVGGEILVLAKERLSIITEPYEIIAEHKGKEMVGMKYGPLYPFANTSESTHKVYEADFVTTEDGTGIVHTAVMYGQEDFDLGTKIGLPKKHIVGADGMFLPDTGFLSGKSVVEESTAVEILKDLQTRGLLFGKENHAHSYPFCWRCKTRLIYYARDSWYVRMSALRNELVKENQKINWEPDHIKEGRFGEWLREVKDWAISRERYWGTPLPVWESKDREKIVLDSVETLKKYTKKSGNKYFVMRHGQAGNNVEKVHHTQNDAHLTEEGRRQVLESIKGIRDKFDVIVASPFPRSKETAEIVCKHLDFPAEQIIYDDRIQEWQPSSTFEGRDKTEFTDYYDRGYLKDLREVLGDGESFAQVVKRAGAFLYELESKYSGKKLLIVGHSGTARALSFAAAGETLDRGADLGELLKPLDNAEIKELLFVPLPHNENFELDLHKPYIDEVVLVKDDKEYRRTKEVMDVWLDSGSMPFAQDPDDIKFPADFISEAIDQTRGWFYTLHAVGVLMGKGRAFKNVICLGHILDKEGKKMSKSVGNVIEPFQAMEKYGADTLRLWMYSVNQPGESKNFDERTVDEINKRIFNLLDNVQAFYELYRDRSLESDSYPHSGDILDKWILSKLSFLTQDMTASAESYKLLEPVRDLRDFVGDLSTWYLRRSRDRIKSGDANAKRTLYYVMKTVSKLLAPFAPFAAEELYQKLRAEADPESVHLEKWPESKKSILDIFGPNDQKLLEDMAETRRIVSLALEARSKANVKIRQPLSKLEVRNSKLGTEYLELIEDEVNVKTVTENPKLETEIHLDTNLTPELLEEGKVREIIRSIQEMRKEKGLSPKDVMEYSVPEENRELMEKYESEIKKATNTAFVTR